MTVCPYCFGTGRRMVVSRDACLVCKGSGKEEQEVYREVLYGELPKDKHPLRLRWPPAWFRAHTEELDPMAAKLEQEKMISELAQALRTEIPGRITDPEERWAYLVGRAELARELIGPALERHVDGGTDEGRVRESFARGLDVDTGDAFGFRRDPDSPGVTRGD